MVMVMMLLLLMMMMMMMMMDDDDDDDDDGHDDLRCGTPLVPLCCGLGINQTQSMQKGSLYRETLGFDRILGPVRSA
eukprot:3042764-Karenia_brevis.AAC.1